jgi:putative hydrolase of the HAD superfamily
MNATTPGPRTSKLVIGFDGDDTLWHNEQLFADTQHQLRELLGHYADMTTIDAKLLEVERRNLAIFGYGVKGFVLSMIETAIEISDARVSARDIHQIVMMGKALLEHPIELLDGVGDVVDELSNRHRLILVTKGDLMHQESKIAASGLADYFWQIEIVSEKDPSTYQRLLDRHAVASADFVMIGNSVASDVLPVLAIGGRAVHVPYHITWALEVAAVDGDDFPILSNLRDVVPLVDGWSS